MEYRVRAASLLVNGKKAGAFEGTTYNYETGDELQFGDPGVVGFSDGAGKTSLDATGIHPTGGMDIPDLQTLAQQKANLEIALSLINGKIHQVTMRITKAVTTSSHQNGTQKGQYSLIGGEPKITG